MSRRALLAGATGLIGSQLLPRLLADPRYTEVAVLTRRALGVAHPKLAVTLTDFVDMEAMGSALRADDVYCCLGATMARAGSRAAFERVDYGLVVELAQAARNAGSRQFLVVSSIGASLGSPSFYGRTKARMERALRVLGYEALHIMRPSLLLGEREERRPLESFAQRLAPLLSPLLRDGLARYRPVPAAEVAEAMHAYALQERRGVQVHVAPFRF